MLPVLFYKFPTAKTLQTWYKKSPAGFVYAVKAPNVITHSKKFVDCEAELAALYQACEAGLKDKLGCVLFQLPPSYAYTPERLALVISGLDPAFQNVIEFRNASWWTKDVYQALRQQRIIFCSVNYPKLPTDVVATSSTAYVRLHGNPRLFYSEYSEAELTALMQQLAAHPFKQAFVYFNNTASPAGIVNALTIKHLQHLGWRIASANPRIRRNPIPT